MKYLLDTNACIRYLNGRAVNLASKLRSISADEIAVCAIVKAELFFGAIKSQMSEPKFARQMQFLNQFQSLPFDDEAAQTFGQIRADLTRRGLVIGPYDMQIAAIALVNNVTVVTHNVREFRRVTGLQIEDWE